MEDHVEASAAASWPLYPGPRAGNNDVALKISSVTTARVVRDQRAETSSKGNQRFFAGFAVGFL